MSEAAAVTTATSTSKGSTVGVLRLACKSNVSWSEEVVDNENAGKKKSKRELFLDARHSAGFKGALLVPCRSLLM